MAETLDKDLIVPLNLLLEANDKLHAAIDATREAWDMPDRCWIDQLMEPTALLGEHRLGKRTGT